MKLAHVALACSMLSLAGCKMNMEADLYSSDLRAAAEGAQEITTPATLFLPITSVDKCAEETAKIAAIMQGIVEPFQPRGCERKDMNSYVLADTQLPIVDSDEAWKNADALFGLIAQHSEGSSDINAFVMMNTEKYGSLNTRVREEFHQRLNLRDSSLTLAFNNDERADVSVFVEHAFVNGQPELNVTYAIPRREQITITLSNVSVGYLERNGWARALTMLDEAEQ